MKKYIITMMITIALLILVNNQYTKAEQFV